jgi:hypothetical protein
VNAVTALSVTMVVALVSHSAVGLGTVSRSGQLVLLALLNAVVLGARSFEVASAVQRWPDPTHGAAPPAPGQRGQWQRTRRRAVRFRRVAASASLAFVMLPHLAVAGQLQCILPTVLPS